MNLTFSSFSLFREGVYSIIYHHIIFVNLTYHISYLFAFYDLTIVSNINAFFTLSISKPTLDHSEDGGESSN